MDSSKRFLVAGFCVVAIAVVTGIVVTSQATNSPYPPMPSSEAAPVPKGTNLLSSDDNDAKWKSRLTEEQYRVTRQKGTEAAFSGKFWNHKGKGVYACVCCATPLFYSSTKFDSNSGWPSFYQPIDDKKIETHVDFALRTQREEVVCRNCSSHLGHVFDDAPEQPTGLRYCINSAALEFQETSSEPTAGK